jgi:hypothetical protein
LNVKADTSHAGTILTGPRTVCDMQILDFKKNADAMTRASLLSFLPMFIQEMGAGNMPLACWRSKSNGNWAMLPCHAGENPIPGSGNNPQNSFVIV